MPVSRLLRQLGGSCQQPIPRPAQRATPAVAAWTEARLPAIKKSRGRRRTRVWVDEAGFYQLPGRVHTYAPCGQTPILTVPLTRDHLSVIGALTDDGRLVQQVRTPAFDGAGLVGFLRHLLRHIAGPLLVLWDGASIHRGQAVKEFFQQIGAERLWLERLPSYAPDWNPVEGV